MCAFLKNGEVVRYFPETTEVELIDQNGLSEWRTQIPVHHTLKLSRNEDKIYLLSHENILLEGVLTRFDTVVALDTKSGMKLSEWSFYSLKNEIVKELGKKLPVVELDKNLDGNEGAQVEVSHFNSINNVPEKFTKQLDFVVNTGRGMVLFFDSNLNLAGRMYTDTKWQTNTHDAQLTEEGTLLLFKNMTEKNMSAIEIHSIPKNELLWMFEQDDSKKYFLSKKYGSVQKFQDGSFLYSDMENGGHFKTISAEGKKINEFYYPENDPRTGRPGEFHTIRRMELEELPIDVKSILENDLSKTLSGRFYLFLLLLD